jgi:hypothetical protein
VGRGERILLALIMLAIIGCCVWFLFRSPPDVDSITGISQYYGVSEETVGDFVRAYGVDPTDIASYGEEPFPLNYIRYTLGWNQDPSNRPTVTRAEIDALVTGYVSRCDLDDTSTLYLFYSDWLRPKTLFRGEALPIEIIYEHDVTRDGIRSDQVVESISMYYIGDSGGWPWEQVAPHCDPPAKY